MKLIIAEKPSVCKSIAHAIGAFKPFGNKYDISCYQNDEYIVTNAFGHLYDIGEPSDYGFKEWSLETLPMNPGVWNFKNVPAQANETSDYAKALARQRSLLSDLLALERVDEIICATDAGREGELIFRYIYNVNKCEKPVKRLWVSSLTEEAIKTAMKNLKPDSDYDNLFLSAFTRAKCDWLFGMNLSRLYSLLDDTAHRVGRVKTPVLSLIVTRDTAIKAHTPENFYVVTLDNGAEATETYKTEEKAGYVIATLRGKPIRVELAEKKEHTENPPHLFSLTTLQQQANDDYGLTAVDTLKAAQSLYEKKLLTYPRTSSEYLTDDMIDDVKNLVEVMQSVFPERKVCEELNLGKHIFDNERISDHHAIIPTTMALKARQMNLTENENRVFNLVCDRLFCAVDNPYVYEQTNYVFTCNGVSLTLKGKTVISPGWRAYHPENLKPCARYAQGETFTPPPDSIKSLKRTKEPPKHYTDSTLLSAMQNIDNAIADKELAAFAKALDNKGLGTPATRAGIIEELVSAGYIERKGKSIYATGFGEEFCNSLPARLKNVERTAEWEQQLTKIEQCGDAAEAWNISNVLYETVSAFVSETISQEIEHKSERTPLVNANPKDTNRPRSERVSLGKCPKCGKDVFEGKQNFYCESAKKDNPCFTLWKSSKFLSFIVTPKMCTELLQKRIAAVSYKDEISGGKITACYTLIEGKNGSFNLKRDERAQ